MPTSYDDSQEVFFGDLAKGDSFKSLGRTITEEFVANGTRALRKALAEADRNRKAGKRLTLKQTEKMKLMDA